MAYKGQPGTYNGSEVKVTKVHEDGALDLQKVWHEPGSAENLPWYERVPADQFTSNEPESAPADAAPLPSDNEDNATIEDLTGGPGDGSTDLAEDQDNLDHDAPVSEV